MRKKSLINNTAVKFLFLINLIFSAVLVSADESYKVLATIKNPVQRQERAIKIQFENQLNKDTASIFRNLKELYNISKSTDDKSLECLYYGFMANQYSIIYDGINEVSNKYHKKSIDLAKNHQLSAIAIVNLINCGYYYYNYRQMVPAFKYFLEAGLLLKTIDIKTVPLANNQFKILGYYYFYIKDYNSAIAYLKQGLNYSANNKRTLIDIANTIALCYYALGKEQEAINYYTKATAVAKASKDSVWVGIIAGNVGRMYLKNGQLDTALAKFKLNRAYSIKFNEPLDAMDAIIDIADVYSLKKQWVLADQYLEEAKTYLKPKPFFLKSKLKIAKICASIADGIGDYQRQIASLKEFALLRDSMLVRDNEAEIERVKLTYEKDLFNKYQERINLEVEQKNFRNRIIISFVLLIVLILVFMVRSQVLKNRHDKTNFEKQELELQLKQQKIERELEIAKISLHNFTDNLKLRNKQLEQLRIRYADFDSNILNGDAEENHYNTINALLKINLMTESSWQNFRNMFVTVHPNFFTEILEIYPLTNESELRMLALIKLDLNNREISNMLGITLEGVKKAKQRLRKKMESYPEIATLVG